MKFEVRLAFRAEKDLASILVFLKSRSPKGAATWLARWQETCRAVSEDPQSCSLAPESVHHSEEIRQVVFKTRRGLPYRMLFVIRGDRILVTNLRGPGQDFVPSTDLPSS